MFAQHLSKIRIAVYVDAGTFFAQRAQAHHVVPTALGTDVEALDLSTRRAPIVCNRDSGTPSPAPRASVRQVASRPTTSYASSRARLGNLASHSPDSSCTSALGLAPPARLLPSKRRRNSSPGGSVPASNCAAAARSFDSAMLGTL